MCHLGIATTQDSSNRSKRLQKRLHLVLKALLQWGMPCENPPKGELVSQINQSVHDRISSGSKSSRPRAKHICPDTFRHQHALNNALVIPIYAKSR